jgi:hypothetical protein
MLWTSVAIGAATFVVAHIIEASLWGFFGGAHQAWFLNSGRAVAFTAACFFTAGLLVGAAGGRTAPMRHGVFLGLGGLLAAMVVLFTRVGAGNLFPIALTIGAVLLMASSVAGLIASRAARRLSARA